MPVKYSVGVRLFVIAVDLLGRVHHRRRCVSFPDLGTWIHVFAKFISVFSGTVVCVNC